MHTGRPRITATGVIELWCAACAAAGPDLRTAPAAMPAPVGVPAIAVEPPAPRGRSRRGRRWRGGAIAAGAVAATGALVLARWTAPRAHAAAATPPAAAVPAILDDDAETAFSHEAAPPPHLRTSRPVVEPSAEAETATDGDGATRAPGPLDVAALDARYPSLTGWVHPVIDSPEPTPSQSSRWFGAAREGLVPRAECGAGHCGIDLDGPRGRAIVAVADGTVVRVEHSELGRDKRSGRYVRIEHADGTLTAYMHLDAIALGLEVGDHVVAGQQIGILGATACYHAAPHLHFSLALPDHVGTAGDNNDNHYADPMPFLARATVLAAPTVPADVVTPAHPEAGS